MASMGAQRRDDFNATSTARMYTLDQHLELDPRWDPDRWRTVTAGCEFDQRMIYLCRTARTDSGSVGYSQTIRH